MTTSLQPFERAALYELYLCRREELQQALLTAADPGRIARLQESVARLHGRLGGEGPAEAAPHGRSFP